MKEQDLEKKLKRALHQPYTIANEKHFENTILLVKEEACQKKKRAYFIFTLSDYADKVYWLEDLEHTRDILIVYQLPAYLLL